MAFICLLLFCENIGLIFNSIESLFQLSGSYVKNIRHIKITVEDVEVAMWADKALMDLFHQDEDVSSVLLEDEPVTGSSLTYDEVVKNLIHEEKQYLRDLHMIIKVFREQIASLVNPSSKVSRVYMYVCWDVAWGGWEVSH